MMFSLVLLIGIGVGLSLPIALELLRATFSSVMRLRGLGLPVIRAVTLCAGREQHGVSSPGPRACSLPLGPSAGLWCVDDL